MKIRLIHITGDITIMESPSAADMVMNLFNQREALKGQVKALEAVVKEVTDQYQELEDSIEVVVKDNMKAADGLIGSLKGALSQILNGEMTHIQAERVKRWLKGVKTTS